MNTQTIEKMTQMRLQGMRQAFETLLETHQQLTVDETLAMLLEAEWDHRQQSRMERYIKQAAFRYTASIEQIRFDPARNLDKNLLIRLADCSFIKKAENILVTGPTGPPRRSATDPSAGRWRPCCAWRGQSLAARWPAACCR